MSTTQKNRGLELRRLPVSARKAAVEKAAGRAAEVARSQFSRVFADVLSECLGGRWTVEWVNVTGSQLKTPVGRTSQVARAQIGSQSPDS